MKNLIWKAILIVAEWLEENIGTYEKTKIFILMVLACLVPLSLVVKNDSELLGLAFIVFIVCIVCLFLPRKAFDAFDEYYEEEEDDDEYANRGVSRKYTGTGRCSYGITDQKRK